MLFIFSLINKLTFTYNTKYFIRTMISIIVVLSVLFLENNHQVCQINLKDHVDDLSKKQKPEDN